MARIPAKTPCTGIEFVSEAQLIERTENDNRIRLSAVQVANSCSCTGATVSRLHPVTGVLLFRRFHRRQSLISLNYTYIVAESSC